MQPFIDRLRSVRVGPERLQPGRVRTVQSSGRDWPQDDGAYKPSPIDIVVVRTLLTRGRKLPPDLVDDIFDYAEYWAHSSNEIDYILEQKLPLRIAGRSQKEDHFLLRSYPIGLTSLADREDLDDVLRYDTDESKPRPLRSEHPPSFFAKLADYPTPRLARPVRKVVFTVRSKDQGHGARRSEFPYDEGWTWIEAGLERFDADKTCESYCVSDSRFKSKDSASHALPTCALRPVYPAFSEKPPVQDSSSDSASEQPAPKEPEYQYDHGYLPAEERLIQRNKTRHREMTTHVVEWSWTDDINPESDGGQELKNQGRGRATGDGTFVRDLKMGDVITIWGKAKFPAWQNNIEKVRIDVYWAV
ncbi:hypothetical protein CC79DRAFT_1330138 [Sarocladium strictum]